MGPPVLIEEIVVIITAYNYMFHCDFSCEFIQCPNVTLPPEHDIMCLYFINGLEEQHVVGKIKRGLCYPRITDLKPHISSDVNFPYLCERLDTPNYYSGCGPDCGTALASGDTGQYFFESVC